MIADAEFWNLRKERRCASLDAPASPQVRGLATDAESGRLSGLHRCGDWTAGAVLQEREIGRRCRKLGQKVYIAHFANFCVFFTIAIRILKLLESFEEGIKGVFIEISYLSLIHVIMLFWCFRNCGRGVVGARVAGAENDRTCGVLEPEEGAQVRKLGCTYEPTGARSGHRCGVWVVKWIAQVTLSGLLNLIDGLWSSCGDERIIIFTTNHVEKLDPALLRPGRMDVHIHMAYCTPCGFRLLASNYLGIREHQLVEEIEELIGNTAVTPAEVAEQLMKEDEVDIALKGLIDFLHKKRKEQEETRLKVLKRKKNK
ncbi:PREDICTED: AAA-ATPase At3g28510-like [Nicotiana attenuata]|uniref:AAA-ATPase At3g28510-like n=1 Tax=Nicotiana attenuata TaxID=49451 RepID=UPI000904DA38|nr:PREDICTED: AAA-ATPase At3g28510-like [Nicotiana attenuata]